MTVDPLQVVIDELLYINYRTNRHTYPEKEGWVKVYGPTTPAMEARYQRESHPPRSNVCDWCQGIIGSWLEYQVSDPDAYICECPANA